MAAYGREVRESNPPRLIINLCSGAFRLRGARFDHHWQRYSGAGG